MKLKFSLFKSKQLVEQYYDFLYPNYHPIRNTSRTLGDCAKLVSNPNAEKFKRKLTWKDFVPAKPKQFKKKKKGRKKGGNSLQKLRNKWKKKKELDKFSRHGKVKNTRKKWSVGVGFFKQVFVNTTKWFLGTKSAWGIFCFGRWKTQNFSALRAEKFNVNQEFYFFMLKCIKRYEFILHQSNQNLNLNSWTERKNLTPHPPPTVSWYLKR